MPSFDIVSEINLQEARNACENAQRELATRFDFRGAEAEFSWDGEGVKLRGESEFQLDQMLDILRFKLVKREVDPETLVVGDIEHSGKHYLRTVTFKQGIDQDVARNIVKLIKAEKFKVQAAIQGDQVRVTGKKRDDLQTVIAHLRGAALGQPLQFNNFRE